MLKKYILNETYCGWCFFQQKSKQAQRRATMETAARISKYRFHPSPRKRQLFPYLVVFFSYLIPPKSNSSYLFFISDVFLFNHSHQFYTVHCYKLHSLGGMFSQYFFLLSLLMISYFSAHWLQKL